MSPAGADTFLRPGKIHVSKPDPAVDMYLDPHSNATTMQVQIEPKQFSISY